jgi:hypothetical protein
MQEHTMQRRTLIGHFGAAPAMAALPHAAAHPTWHGLRQARRHLRPPRPSQAQATGGGAWAMPRLMVALAAVLPLVAAAKGGPICFDFGSWPAGTHPAANQVIVMGDLGRAQRQSTAAPGRTALRIGLDGSVMRVTLDLAHRPSIDGAAPALLAVNDRRPGSGDGPPRVSVEPLPGDDGHAPGQRLRIESWAGIRSVTLAVAEPQLQRICVER